MRFTLYTSLLHYTYVNYFFIFWNPTAYFLKFQAFFTLMRSTLNASMLHYTYEIYFLIFWNPTAYFLKCTNLNAPEEAQQNVNQSLAVV